MSHEACSTTSMRDCSCVEVFLLRKLHICVSHAGFQKVTCSTVAATQVLQHFYWTAMLSNHAEQSFTAAMYIHPDKSFLNYSSWESQT